MTGKLDEIQDEAPSQWLQCIYGACFFSMSADSPSDEILNRGHLALLLRRQYEFPLGINIVQFSMFIFN